MANGPRNRLQTDERRAQLIALGVRLFSHHPYEQVSIEDISEQAGISRGLLYHYFGNKRGFYVACIKEAAAELASFVRPRPETEKAEVVGQAVQRYLDWVEARADAYLALMHGGMGHDPEVSAIIEQTRAQIIQQINDRIGLDAPRPVFDMALRAWIGGVEAAAERWLATRAPAREVLANLLGATLRAHILAAIALDPDAPIQL